MGTVVPHDGTAERNRTSLPEQEVIQREEMSDNFRETWKDRKAKLDELGFVWRKQTQRVQWIDRFEQLKQYKAENGHCNVPKNDFNRELGTWCQANRNNYIDKKKGKKSPMTEERISLLESVGFQWVLKKHNRLNNDQLSQPEHNKDDET